MVMAASEPVPVVAFSAEAMWDNVVASMKLEESDASKETAESDSSTTVCDTEGEYANRKAKHQRW